MKFSSQLLQRTVDAFATLPGIGRKSALRLALHLLQQDKEKVRAFTNAITELREGIARCRVCYNLSDASVCEICADGRRDHALVCVVESIRDVMAIEATNQFNGLYHVLGGIISPLEGIGPSDLTIEALVERVAKGEVREVIFAVNPTIEGDTTAFYIAKKLEGMGVVVSSVARGIAFGGELQYADELTLGRSIAARTPYQK